MSGEKTAKWSLATPGDPNALSWDDARTRIAEYEQKAETLRSQLETIAKTHTSLGIKIESAKAIPYPENGQQLVAALNEVQDRHNRYFRELKRAKEAIEADEKFKELVASAAASAPEKPAKNDERWQELRRKIDGIRLKEWIREDASQEIEELCKKALAVSPDNIAELKVSYRELTDLVSKRGYEARDRDAARNIDMRLATQLLHELRGTAANTDLLARLEATQRGESDLSTELVEKAKKAAAAKKAHKVLQETRADRRRRAAEMIKSVLVDFDYTPEEDFETAFVKDGEVDIQKPAWNDFFCRLTIDPETEELRFRMALESDGPLTRDEIVEGWQREETWCEDFKEITKKLEEKGLGLGLTKHIPAGQEPIMQLPRRKTKKRDVGGEQETVSTAQLSLGEKSR